MFQIVTFAFPRCIVFDVCVIVCLITVPFLSRCTEACFALYVRPVGEVISLMQNYFAWSFRAGFVKNMGNITFAPCNRIIQLYRHQICHVGRITFYMDSLDKIDLQVLRTPD